MVPVCLSYLDVLTSVFRSIYTVMLGPVLSAFLAAMWKQLIDFFQDLVFEILFRIFHFLLNAVVILDQMITLFSGLGSYSYNGVDQNQGIFQYFFNQQGIGKLLGMITILAVCLSVIFTIYSTGKSISDSVLDPNYKPVSKVLAEAFKTAMTFAATPILCILILQLATAVLNQISIATSEVVIEQTVADSGVDLQEDTEEYMKFRSSQPGVADILFQIHSQDAITNKRGALNIYTKKNGFQSTEEVKKNFNIQKITYFSGLLSVGFVVVILFLTTLGFAIRIFEILILYMTAPLFTATIPLDGGGKYRKWREMFIAKLAGAFGPIFTMKLFLILMPLITSSRLQFSDNTAADWLMKMLLMCGAIYAVFKGRHMVIEIFSPEAAASMRRSERLMSDVVKKGADIAMKSMGVGFGTGGIPGLGPGGDQGGKDGGNDGTQGGDTGGNGGTQSGQSQAFRG